MKSEYFVKAQHDATFLLASLECCLSDVTSLEKYVVMDLIIEAARLRQRLNNFVSAVDADKSEAK